MRVPYFPCCICPFLSFSFLKEPQSTEPTEGWGLEGRIIVGLFALPCSFRSPFVDSTCSLYGRPVRVAIQLLLVN